VHAKIHRPNKKTKERIGSKYKWSNPSADRRVSLFRVNNLRKKVRERGRFRSRGGLPASKVTKRPFFRAEKGVLSGKHIPLARRKPKWRKRKKSVFWENYWGVSGRIQKRSRKVTDKLQGSKVTDSPRKAIKVKSMLFQD